MHFPRLFVLIVLFVTLSACQVQTTSPPSTEVQISDLPTEIVAEPGISMDPFEVDLTDLEVFKPGLIEEIIYNGPLAAREETKQTLLNAYPDDLTVKLIQFAGNGAGQIQSLSSRPSCTSCSSW